MLVQGLQPDSHASACMLAPATWHARSLLPCRPQEAWFEPIVIRSLTAQRVLGGVSAVTAAIVKLFFEAPHSMDQAGLTLELHSGRVITLFVIFGYFMGDEAAIHYVYGCKGASGLKPCLLCANCFKADLGQNRGIFDREPFARPHTCSKFDEFVPHTPASIIEVLKTLAIQAAKNVKTHLEELETRLGWNHAPGGLLLEPSLFNKVEPTSHCLSMWAGPLTAFPSRHVSIGCSRGQSRATARQSIRQNGVRALLA